MTQVFSTEWFAKNQRALLSVLNAPVIGHEFRSAICIQERHRKIARIFPNGYILANGDGSLQADFRTHDKFAKVLRYRFGPIWRAAHAWDKFVANPLAPALNLGFDTLTFFPDPSPEVTSVDGRVDRQGVDESWAAIIAGAGNNFNFGGNPLNLVRMAASATTNQWSAISRGIFLFDSRALTLSALISAATLSLFGTSKTDTLGVSPDIDIYTSSPASPTSLTGADYSTIGSASQTTGPITFASWSTSAYNDFTLSVTGIGNVSRDSVSKFGARNANFDVAAVAPTWTSAQAALIACNFADQSGTSNDPKLVVTFTLTLFVNIQEPVLGSSLF